LADFDCSRLAERHQQAFFGVIIMPLKLNSITAWALSIAP